MRTIEEILRSRTTDNKILATAEEMRTIITEGISIIKNTDDARHSRGFASSVSYLLAEIISHLCTICCPIFWNHYNGALINKLGHF
jgi:hypothetical protein